jgi:hypothetical protein
MTSEKITFAPTCGPDGCSINPATASTPQVQGSALELQIVSDAICPWCYIANST